MFVSVSSVSTEAPLSACPPASATFRASWDAIKQLFLSGNASVGGSGVMGWVGLDWIGLGRGKLNTRIMPAELQKHKQ